MSSQFIYKKVNILIIDNDQNNTILLSNLLTSYKYVVTVTHSGGDGLKILLSHSFDVILYNYCLPDINGVELLLRLKVINPSSAVIIINGNSDVKTAVEALRNGAHDFITKPFDHVELLSILQDTVEKKRAKRVTHAPPFDELLSEKFGRNSSSINSTISTLSPISLLYSIGRSIQSQIIQRNIELIAPSDISVIIKGETGTGKEYVARFIHALSNRSDYPFMAIDCGALPKELAGSELFGHTKGSFTGASNDRKGSFEIADGGTVFLGEIGNLSYENQIRLLRVLQERRIKRIGASSDIAIDVRIVAATHENLTKAVQDGRLREDLYHRLNEFSLHLLPLRDRKDDIMFYAEYFLKMANQMLNKSVESISVETEHFLTEYYWPGNLRELNSVIKRAVLLTTGKCILPDSLAIEVLQPSLSGTQYDTAHGNVSRLKLISWAAERQAILDVLEKVNYNKSRASVLLNIDRKTLYNKLKLYSILY